MIDVKNETACRLEKKGIPREVTESLFQMKLITEHTAKRFLIVDTFQSRTFKRGEKEGVKEAIAEDFCVSGATVHAYLFRK